MPASSNSFSPASSAISVVSTFASPTATDARGSSAADHHTKGRLAWNIVTSCLESGAKNVGDTGLRTHDDRYAVAAAYVEVLYKLFGAAARLPHAHPAARFRDIEQVKRDAEPVADYA